MVGLHIALLDGYKVRYNGKAIPGFETRKVQALLAYLAVEGDRPHRRDHLAGLLWGEQPQEKALHSLRQAASTLRRILPQDPSGNRYFFLTADTIQFNRHTNYQLDVEEFNRLAIEGMPASRQRLHPARLAQAAALFHTPFLDQFYLKDAVYFEEWAVLKREVLNQQMNNVLVQACGYHERRREYMAARQYASRMMQLMPWSEYSYLTLMRLYALEGDYAAAEHHFFLCRNMCRQQLDMEPSQETLALFETIRKRQFSVADSPQESRPVSGTEVFAVPLVGRQREMNDLADALANTSNRLITLHGTGGVGKTRLALELADSQVGIFRDGVFFIRLAALTSPDQLPAQVARSLGLELSAQQDAEKQVLDYLRRKQVLLVLDNFDTLLQYKQLLLDWLQGAPEIVILVTSRERLNLSMELVYTLEGLDCVQDTCAECEIDSPAVCLFRQYAHRLGVKNHQQPGDQQAMLDICRQVEGLPLALELAAASAWNQSLVDISRSIRQNITCIGVSYQDVQPRHRSLWATLEYSTHLLSSTQLECFYQMAVFPADFSHQTAQEISSSLNGMLNVLMDKSLLRRSGSGRYEMHPLTRQFACRGLESHEPLYERTRKAFIDYFYRYVLSQNLSQLSSNLSEAIHSLESELPAILKACQWMADCGDIEDLFEMLPSLFLFYSTQSRFSEALAFFDQIKNLVRDDERKEALCIRLGTYSGVFFQLLNNATRAEVILQENLQKAANKGMKEEQVLCLIHLASCSQQRGEMQDASQLAKTALEISQREGIVWGEAQGNYEYSQSAYRSGEVDVAREYLEECLKIGRRFEAPFIIMPALNLLADMACHVGDYLQGEQMFNECLATSRALNSRYHQAVHLNNLGTIYHLQKKYEQAQRLYEQSLEQCKAIGASTREGIVRSNLGEIAMLQGDEMGAEACFRQAYDIGCDIDDHYLMTVSLNNLAEIARRQERFKEALTCLNTSVRISSQSQLLPKLMIALYIAACVLQDQGRFNDCCALLELVARHPSSEEDTRKLAADMLAGNVEEEENSILSIDEALSLLAC